MQNIHRDFTTRLISCGLAIISLVFTGCTSTSSVRLEKALSLEAFENLVTLDRQPATIAVVIPAELRNAVIVQQSGEIIYTLDIGNTLGSKLMQVLGYKFDRVVLMPDEKSNSLIPWDLRMRVELIESDLSLNTKAGWSSYTVKSDGYVNVKATVVNKSEQVVWVGSARADGKGESAATDRQVPDIQGGLSKAIDVAVAQIAAQLTKSESLRKAINDIKR